MSSLPEAVEVLGVRIHPVTESELVDVLTTWAREGSRRKVYYVNAHALNLAHDNSEFRDLLNRADLVYCDGFGAKWAARAMGQMLPERMAIPDWIDHLLERLDDGVRLFLLGDEAEVVEHCADFMARRHPGLRIAGIHDGFFDPSGDENRAICEMINGNDATVLLVGMGMPRQETWIESNVEDLNVALALGVGALFGVYSGDRPRAPRWMTENGIEWLGRLAVEPRRMSHRYVIGNTRLVARVARKRMSR